MNLNEWAAQTKRSLFDELGKGAKPSYGEYNPVTLEEARIIGKPQIGATVYSPDAARFEFVYSGASSTIVFSVSVTSPERIVFMPVPAWVIESIWQGDIDGSYHFEPDAETLAEEFRTMLSVKVNSQLFGRKAPTRRE